MDMSKRKGGRYLRVLTKVTQFQYRFALIGDDVIGLQICM